MGLADMCAPQPVIARIPTCHNGLEVGADATRSTPGKTHTHEPSSQPDYAIDYGHMPYMYNIERVGASPGMVTRFAFEGSGPGSRYIISTQISCATSQLPSKITYLSQLPSTSSVDLG